MKFLSLSSILVLGLSLAIFSCQKQTPPEALILNKEATSFVSPRTTGCGLGDFSTTPGCVSLGPISLEVDMGVGCIATVVMEVVFCELPSAHAYYFQEVQITIPPTCDIAVLDDNFVEEAYDNFILLYLENVVADEEDPNRFGCIGGILTFQTTWVRMTCTMGCVSIGEEGYGTYQNVPCALQQGCCRHEKSFCIHDGEIINILDYKWVDGECDGFFSPIDCQSKKGCQEITCE